MKRALAYEWARVPLAAGGGTLAAGGAGRAVGAVLLLTVLSGLAGVALGGLLRHSGLAIGVFAVWAFVVEITLGVLARVPATVLPFTGTALFAAPGVGAFGGLVAVALVAAVFATARDGRLG